VWAGFFAKAPRRIFCATRSSTACPVVELPGVFKAFAQGDSLEVNLAAGAFYNLQSGVQLSFTPPPDFTLEMISAGGVYPLLTRMAHEGRLPKR
jgi:hypothetical protein